MREHPGALPLAPRNHRVISGVLAEGRERLIDLQKENVLPAWDRAPLDETASDLEERVARERNRRADCVKLVLFLHRVRLLSARQGAFEMRALELGPGGERDTRLSDELASPRSEGIGVRAQVVAGVLPRFPRN
ncbi:MAG TPA: hypothetical protein VE175_01710 [Woeseiaceae bacterium]|nr:hypothetical protein [Woeseiaceae bacterium]